MLTQLRTKSDNEPLKITAIKNNAKQVVITYNNLFHVTGNERHV